MQPKQKKHLGILIGSLIVGVIIGMLVSPTKGSTIRNRLLFSLRRCRDRLHGLLLKMRANKDQMDNYAKDHGKEIIADIVNSANQIIKEFDLLTKQLKKMDHIKH